MASFRFRPVTVRDAQVFCTWRYEGIHRFYDVGPAAMASFLEPRFRYHAVDGASGRLIGYCCFGEDARVIGIEYETEALDIGFGLAPDLTGRGLGVHFVAAVLDYARRTYDPEELRLSVALFNRRARRVYRRLGFRIVGEQMVARRGVALAYQVLALPAAELPTLLAGVQPNETPMTS